MAKAAPTILIVEDDIDTRDLVGRFLTGAGYNVRVASNGWEGLLTIKDGPVDLVLLDIMMPGMDGIMFLQSLQGVASCERMPVIIMTALDARDVLEDVRQYGVQHVLRKGDGLYRQIMGVLTTYLTPPPPPPPSTTTARATMLASLPDPAGAIRSLLHWCLAVLAWELIVCPPPPASHNPPGRFR